MNQGQFFASINSSIAFLKKYNLLRDGNQYHIKGASRRQINWADKTKSYIDIYREVIENSDYDILLFDESAIHFSISKVNRSSIIRYCYLQFPHDVPSYDEFLNSCEFDFEVIGDEFRNEYEQLLSEAGIDISSASIRYDYSEREYTPGIHPVSHFHIGHDNSIRIPISKVVTPHMFVMFILKQIYYKQWIDLIGNHTFFRFHEATKRTCCDVARSLFVSADKQELYLT